MGVATSKQDGAATSAGVIWHDLECGFYAADLALWRELAERARSDGAPAPILDVGAGTGRVALDLAAAGHAVTAVDLDAELLDALSERAAGAGLQIETVCADACSFDLDRRDFAVCLVPMQTIQLLGGSAERLAFLRRARAHLRPGGMLACAIVTVLEPFDCAGGDVGPAPETAHVGDAIYASRATRVGVLERDFIIERERRIVPLDKGGSDAWDSTFGLPSERSVVELNKVSTSELEHEATVAGLRLEPAREIPPTHDHVGSTVVMLGA